MREDVEKIYKAKRVLQRMAGGINPFNGEKLEEGSFLHDPRMIRCLHYVCDLLDDHAENRLRSGSNKAKAFNITPQQKGLIELPDRNIGVNEFARCVNRVLSAESKRLTGALLNKQLKKMGILSEEIMENGKTRTIINEKSQNYGIVTEKRNYDGNEFEMILFNAEGKEYLLRNLESIMSFAEE
ncbi:MAG: hypothetical protein AB1796_05190 [Bacillota bacterium]